MPMCLDIEEAYSCGRLKNQTRRDPKIETMRLKLNGLYTKNNT
jgi:hypothetical protein